MSAVGDLSDQEMLVALTEHGSEVGAAKALKVDRSTFRRELDRRGLKSPTRTGTRGPTRRRGAPRLTRESLHEAVEPPNRCRVKAFLDSLHDEDRELVEEALGYDRQDLSATVLRTWLTNAGFPADDIPGTDAINAHRKGDRPCRCKG